MSVLILEALDNVKGGVDDIKTMADLPPEILTKVLEYLLDRNRKAELSYRLVNSQWKSIIDRLLEEKLSSTWLQPFPVLKLTQSLCVNVPPTISPGDPFPFGSLLVRGAKEGNTQCVLYGAKEESYSDSQEEAILSEFARSFAVNLTTFALVGLQIDFSLLANVLGSMSNLKRLCLSNVNLKRPVCFGISTPPPLANLSVLELRSGPGAHQSYMPYMWLVAIYADQLVRLNLTATDPFLPLLKQHEYYVNLNVIKMFIATSSDAAFKKVKELRIYRPTEEFLRLSETPALQHFSMTGLPRYRMVMLGDFMKFMVSCRDLLQTVFVNVNWNDWGSRRGRRSDLEPNQFEGTVPNLKKFSIPFPSNNSHKMLLYKNLLSNFRGLEVLQLIRFGEGRISRMMDPGNNGLEIDGDKDYEECALLQQHMTYLTEQETLIQGELDALLLSELEEVRKRRISAQKRSMHSRLFLGAVERRLHFQRKEEQATLKQQIEVNKNDKAVLLQRLDVLNRKAAIAQELQECGIWSSCPKLKVVSVSSGVTVSGDICVLKRINGELS